MAEFVKLSDASKSASFQLKLLDDEKHWADRAEEVRTIAENITDLEAKRLMLSVAASYDQLAMHAIKRRIAKRYD